MVAASIDLSRLQAQVWDTAEAQGHHAPLASLDPRLQTLVRLALVHTEISEAYDAVYASLVPDRGHLVEELADTAIRLLEMCWCLDIPLRIAPSLVYVPPGTQGLLNSLERLHALVSGITQCVKRHGIVPEVAGLTATALEACWEMAQGLGSDLGEAIEAKDEKNRGRAYMYGTPGEQGH